MIKKVVKIVRDADFDDSVNLSWFDMQKPNLSAVSQKGVNFIVKTEFTHLHQKDVLLCEDGYKIAVEIIEDNICEFVTDNCLEFAKIAYEIGNRHQMINIEKGKITAIEDMSIEDIVQKYSSNPDVTVTKAKGHFKPNGKAHHTH